MLAFGDMMRKRITMPGQFMDDGRHGAANGGRALFDDFVLAAEDVGVYTASDYCDIMEHLIQRWDIAHLPGLSDAAAQERDYVCQLAPRLRRLAERRADKRASAPRAGVAFSWLHDRQLALL
jgi:acyl-[acyl-carrier-protein] desaturase